MDAMIDPLKAVIQMLLADERVTQYTSTQIGPYSLYTRAAGDGGWDPGMPAMTVKQAYGFPELYVRDQLARLEMRAYAPSMEDARRIYLAVVSISRDNARKVVTTNDGDALIYYLAQSTPPSDMFDETIQRPFILWYMEALVSEQAIG